MKRTQLSLAAALSICALTGCGLINGIQGPDSEPAGTNDGGNKLDGGSLAALAWHGPEQLDQGFPTQSDAPRLAWGQGKAWVAWQEYNAANGTYRTWITNRAIGGDFATPQAIGQLSDWDGGAFNPDIAVGTVGDPVLLVQEVQAEPPGSGVFPTSIWSARLSQGLTVTSSDLVRLDASATLSARITPGLSLAIDAAGSAVAAWGTNEGVFASGQGRSTGWTDSVQISTAVAYYDVAAGAAGAGMAAWGAGTGGNFESYGAPLAFSSGTISISGSTPVSTGTTVQPLVAMRGTKGMAVGANSSGLVTVPYNNGVWGSPIAIPDTHLSYYIAPSLAINSHGQAVLIWRDAGTGDAYSGTLQAALWNGSSWSAPAQISANSTSPRAWWAQVDINEEGSAIAAWADFESTGTYTRIYANLMSSSSGAPIWRGAEAIDQDSPSAGLAGQPENVRYVNVRLEPAGGHAQIVWMQHESGGQAQPRTWSNWLE